MPTLPSPVAPQAPAAPHTVEAIAAAYLAAAEGDPALAMRKIIVDALTDLCEAERRTLRRDRLISHGYVRGGLQRRQDAAASSTGDQSGRSPSTALVSSTSGATCP